MKWNSFAHFPKGVILFFYLKVPVFLLQGDRFHQAAAETVPQVVPLLPGLLHSLLSQDAIQGRHNLTLDIAEEFTFFFAFSVSEHKKLELSFVRNS